MDEQQMRMAEELLFSGTKKPSFAKMLFFGICDAARVFPFPTPSPSEVQNVDEFVSKLDAYAQKQIDGDLIDRNKLIPESVIKGLGDLGMLGLTIPKEFGGKGMSQYAYCRANETIARYCSGTALFVNAHQSIGLKALLLFGTPKQKDRWLEPLATGAQLAAFALTEPNAGSDAAGVETRAVYDPVKKVYRINGQKQWITNGAIAGVLTVMAKTEVETPHGKEDKVTAFLVTPDMPGFKVKAEALEKVGMRGTKTALLEFNDVEVPAENILGPLGGGLRVCLTVLDYGRVTFGASCTGTAKVLLERALHHAKTRYQFKRPLASFGLVKKKLARMAAYTYAMDAATYLTAGLLDRGEDDIMLEAAILKVFTSDALWRIIYDTMQIYGGRSFFTDHPFERNMRDARLNMIGEGSNEVLQAFIGLVGLRDVGMQLKDAFKTPGDVAKLLKSGWIRFTQAPVPVRSERLKKEARLLTSAVKKFGFAVTRVLAEHREEVIEKQLTLDRLATAVTMLYTAAAVLSKLDDALVQNGEPDTPYAVAKYYFHHALKVFERKLSRLFDNDDLATEAVAELLTGIPAWRT